MSTPIERTLQNEYTKLNEETKLESLTLDTTYSTSFFNSHKNRYENVLPPLHSRVILSGSEGQDYINANYIRGYYNERQYIAAQAPLKNTFSDWWRMIYEQKIQLVVMLTRLQENGKSKADVYWPEAVGKSLFSGPFLIILNQEIHYSSEITLRYLTLKCKAAPNVEQKIVQVHFLGWPDFGKPANTFSFLQLIGFMESYQQYCQEKQQTVVGVESPEDMEMDMDDNNKRQVPPILLHCSAGIGRTGTLISCHTAWQCLSNTISENINIREIIKDLRRYRTGMVQSVEQYMFIYEVVNQLKDLLGKTGAKRHTERTSFEQVENSNSNGGSRSYNGFVGVSVVNSGKQGESDPRPYPVQVRG